VTDSLAELLARRRSVRGFKPDPIDPENLRGLFAAAQHAASWCNIQPWRVAVTAPPFTDELRATMLAAAKSGFPGPDLPFPLDYPEPYLTHRRACGGALYTAMGIARDDKAARYDAWLRNYAFFDAPHVAIVSVDKRMIPYALIDVGVWLGAVLPEATARGIDTCPMASVAAYPKALRAALPIAETDAILFGIALGYEDPNVPANGCRTTRDPVDANVTFLTQAPTPSR
jgi:nitroreductase